METIKKPVLFYLRVLAKIQLKKNNPVVIGIGGASGKSSLSHLIYLILSDKYKVRYAEGKNSETGIPLAILNHKLSGYSKRDWIKTLLTAPLRIVFDWKRFDVYVAEMGIDGPKEPKNMAYLLKIIRPDIGVLTNIFYEHSEYFEKEAGGSGREKEDKILELTEAQEGLLLKSVKKEGTAVLNLDDKRINDLSDSLICKKITVSKESADFKIMGVSGSLSGFVLKFEHRDRQYSIKLKQPLSNHYSYSILLAIAVGFSLGVSIEDCILAIERKFSLPPGRMSVFEGIKGTTIIDSSYNSSPLPLFDALDFLKSSDKKRRKVAILGDMRELGIMSERFHEEAAEKIAETADFAVLIGPLMSSYALPVLEKKNFGALGFKNFADAKAAIQDSLKEGDIILVKGSQNTLFLERVVGLLLKNPKDKTFLCRRGDFWERKRESSL